MKRHRHRHHHNHHILEKFLSNISLDMVVYAIYPIFQFYRSIEVGKNVVIIALVLDATILGILWLKVIPTIYKRNKEERTDKSQSGIVLNVIAITLGIAIIKDYIIMTI